MTRKSLVLTVLLLVGLVAAGLGALYGLLRHEPTLYRQAEVEPGPGRTERARQFSAKLTTLFSDLQECDKTWDFTVTQEQVNSWLNEDFITSHTDQLLPEEISDPRVVFDQGRVGLAFRYGKPDFSTVITIQTRIWLPNKRERNLIAVEIEQLRAGAMPLALKVLQEHVTEAARSKNIDVQWYRHQGNPVALLRLQSDKREPTILLNDLHLDQGSLRLRGKTLDRDLRSPIVPAAAVLKN